MSSADAVVVGGGLIGTATAWRLAQAGLDVAQVVGERALAASRVAAGMLAPVTETTFTERALLALNQASSSRWPTFADEVEEASGRPSGLRRVATLSVAAVADDAARRATGPVPLARALVALAGASKPSFALGAAGTGTAERIGRLAAEPGSHRLLSAAVYLLACALVALPVLIVVAPLILP